MDQSNQSAEIISLGKKLVKELNLENSTNTLSRWMAHYVAELITKAESESSDVKKRKFETECCDTILKIWANRKHLPDGARPLSTLTNILSVLNAIKRKKKSIEPWRRFDTEDLTPWGKFTRRTVENYDYLITLAISANLTKETLKKEKEWLEHGGLLSDEERTIIEQLDYLIERDEEYGIKIVFYDPNKKEEKKPTDRQTKILDRLQALITKQDEIFEELKKSILGQALSAGKKPKTKNKK